VLLDNVYYLLVRISLSFLTEDLPEWEKELQAELQEYEVVDDGTNDLDDADLEEEIMKQIEAAGDDAEKAVKALEKLIDARFNESE
jgi:phosphotransferase system HPr-like phosphotransfer protein